MENIFSFRRIRYMLRRYFLENYHREIMFWSVITFTFTILDHRDFVLLVLFVSGLIYSVRLNNDLLKGTKSMHFLLIPATHAEKIASTVILNTFYHFGMTLLSYSIGNLLVMFTYHFILKMQTVPVNWDLFQDTSITISNGAFVPVVKNVFWSVLGLFAFSQSLFMAGSLYFNKNAIGKTILSVILLGFSLFVLQVIIFKTFWDVKHLMNAILPMIVVITDFTIPTVFKTAFVIGSYLLIPFMWVLSYFILTEKEV